MSRCRYRSRSWTLGVVARDAVGPRWRGLSWIDRQPEQRHGAAAFWLVSGQIVIDAPQARRARPLRPGITNGTISQKASGSIVRRKLHNAADSDRRYRVPLGPLPRGREGS